MPIYEFACPHCGHHFDHLQKLSDPDPTVCPACHAESLHRMLSAPTFRLAGTGWYETDFKKPGEKKHHLADGGAPTASAPSTSAAAKPATAAAASSSSS